MTDSEQSGPKIPKGYIRLPVGTYCRVDDLRWTGYVWDEIVQMDIDDGYMDDGLCVDVGDLIIRRDLSDSLDRCPTCKRPL